MIKLTVVCHPVGEPGDFAAPGCTDKGIEKFEILM
jgi:hypothetical protein